MAKIKLDKPPYAHNWVRYIDGDVGRMTKNLVRFELGHPTTTYAAAGPIIRDRIVLSLDLQTALIAALTTGRANSRSIVYDYVTAFFEFDETRRYSGRPCFDEVIEPFRVSKSISIPVKPTATIVENGNLTPIFSVGWASFPLTKWQYRLLATIFEDAVFSLTDFRKSPGEFLCFPKHGDKENAKRRPLVWKRGDFDLLSKGELRDTLDAYLVALENARAIVAAEKDKNKPHPTPTRPGPTPLLDWGND